MSDFKMMGTLPTGNFQISRSAIGFPTAAPAGNVYFDFHAAVSLREMALASGLDTPLYLLAPEIAALLHYFPDMHQRLLIQTLWNTGARINEALALTPAQFNLENGDAPFIVLKTLKQRRRGKGRPFKDEELNRAVPLLDGQYVRMVREYMATFKCKRHEPLWPVTDDTVRNWIKRALDLAKKDNVTFSIYAITPKTFRHSFAMHLIQHHVPLKVVQAYMGHKEISSTEVYTQVFALDVGRHYGVQFSMPADIGLQQIHSMHVKD